jgi:prepilin-type N-terminal cleavage/methylation domain-containing protein
MNERDYVSHPPEGEHGFSLIEALIAMVIMSFGLIAITNLFVVSAASNSIANHTTATAAAATEVMERLKAIDYLVLAPPPAFTPIGGGGTLAMDTSNPADRPVCIDNPAGPPPPVINDCVVVGNYEALKIERGVGELWVRWTIVNPGAGGTNTLFITVRAESAARLAGRRSRAEFTAFRTCTAQGCP